MKAYLLFAKNEFLSELAYRFNAVLRAVSTLIAIYVEIAIWHALYAQSNDMQTSYGVISLTDMIAYAVMSAIVNTLVRNRVIFGIDDRIKTGDIAFDLNRPLSFWGMLLSKTDLLFCFSLRLSLYLFCRFFLCQFQRPNTCYTS